jgi:hypothetical protein
MASNLYETLKEVEQGRQDCINKARLAGLQAGDNYNFSNIAALFLQKNTKETIPEDTWVRPSEWPDTKNILANAEEKIQDGTTYYPAYIVLVDDSKDAVSLTKTGSYLATQGDAYVFSDEPETLYIGNTEHTWDTTKDINTSLGYNCRYYIVYVLDKQLTDTIKFNNNPYCIEIIIGDIKTFADSGTTTPGNAKNRKTPFSISKNHAIINFETTEVTDCSKSSYYAYAFDICNNLKNVVIHNAPYIYLQNGSNRGFMYNCYNLQKVSLPQTIIFDNETLSFYNCYNLTTIDMPNLETIYNHRMIGSGCRALKKISFPKLKVLTALQGSYAANFFADSANRLIEVDLPLLEEISTYNTTYAPIFLSYYCGTELSLPKLKTMQCQAFCTYASHLRSVFLPELTHLEATTSLFGESYTYKTIEVSSDYTTGKFNTSTYGYMAHTRWRRSWWGYASLSTG